MNKSKMGTQVRNGGLNYERRVMRRLRDIFPQIATSRNESRTQDAKGIDLCNTDGWEFQLKRSINNPNYHRLLSLLGDHGVVLHEKTERVGEKFRKIGEYATMKADLFYQLINFIQLELNGAREESECREFILSESNY